MLFLRVTVYNTDLGRDQGGDRFGSVSSRQSWASCLLAARRFGSLAGVERDCDPYLSLPKTKSARSDGEVRLAQY
jgi:hypothetical protein